MAIPNIINASSLELKVAGQAVGTSATAIVSNASASNNGVKVISLYVSNVDGTNAADITADVFDGSTAYEIASTVTVSADSTLVIISEGAPIYLEEGWSLRLTASAASDLEAVCSYQVVTDP